MTLQHEQIRLDRSTRFSLCTGPQPASRRRPTPRRGTVHGAWWPHTDDLVAELAALDVEALQRGRVRPVDRIMYNTDDWQPAPKRTTLSGRSVRLAGYRHLPAHTVCVLGVDRTRLVLLVIPPLTGPATAQALLSAASRPGNELTARELVADTGRQMLEHTQNADALLRWDDEGGRVLVPAGSTFTQVTPRRSV